MIDVASEDEGDEREDTPVAEADMKVDVLEAEVETAVLDAEVTAKSDRDDVPSTED